MPFLGSVAHQGFVRSAENVVADTLPVLRSAAANPELAGYALVVTGHSLGGCVGLGYVESDEAIDRAFILEAKWEIEVAGKRLGAMASLSPMYDPRAERVKS